jgi:hypothetical protein
MAAPRKDILLAGRIDAKMSERVDDYIEAAYISMSDLVRKSVEEYMANHPMKEIE